MHQDVNSNFKGSLLKKREEDSDSGVPEFSLPPKSIVKRPKKSIRKRSRSKWKKCCGKCCRYCGGVFLALVLSACMLSTALLFWFSLRLYRDVEMLSRRLTIEVNRVQAEQISNVEKCSSIETTMKQNIKHLQKGQQDIDEFKGQLQMSYVKIAILNGTLSNMLHLVHSGKSKVSLYRTVDALQKGMADTGAEITKLSDEVKQMEKEISSQSVVIGKMYNGLYNVSAELANLTGKPMKSFHVLNQFLVPPLHRESDSKQHKNHGSPKWNTVEVLHSVNLSAAVKQLQADIEVLKNNKNSNNSLPTKLLDDIYKNGREIQLLWKELELQNQTMLHIQQIINEEDTDIPLEHPGKRKSEQSSTLEDNFDVFRDETV